MMDGIQKGDCIRDAPNGEVYLVEEVSREGGMVRGVLKRIGGSTVSFSTPEHIGVGVDLSAAFSRKDALRPVEVCPLCHESKSNAAPAFQVPQLFWLVDVLVCSRCGLVFKQERLCDAWLARLYGSTYQHFRSVPDPVHASLELRDRVRRIGRPRGRHLDYGCGSGSFVMAALNAGWDSIGCDPFLPVIDRSHPLADRLHRVGAGDVHTLGTFDQITMWATVEHLSDLLPTFTSLRAVLRPGGRLLFNSPNGNSLAARRGGARWQLALLAEHLVFFTPRCVHWLASEMGMCVVGFRFCGNPYPFGLTEPSAVSQGIPPDLVPASVVRLHLNQGERQIASVRPARGIASRLARSGISSAIRPLIHWTRIGDHLEVQLAA